MSISIKVKIVDYNIKNIKQILNGLQSQIFKNFKVVVNDNGLNDLSFNLCKSYQRKNILKIECLKKEELCKVNDADYTICINENNIQNVNDKLFLANFNLFIRKENNKQKIYQYKNNKFTSIQLEQILKDKIQLHELFFQDENDANKLIKQKNYVKQQTEHKNNVQIKSEDILFSIIVASYNYSNYIKMTLNSLVDQTYKNFEIIVVDDGSTDDSVEVIKEYQKHYPQIKLFQHEDKKNHGLVETIKLGILKSKGEYISFCESDDYWTIDHIQKEYDLIKKYNNDPCIIINDIIAIGDPQICLKLQNGSNLSMSLFPNEVNIIDLNQFKSGNKIMTFSCTTVKRNEILKCNFNIPVKAWLDWNIWTQILNNNNKKLYVIHNKTTFWRAHKDSQIQKKIEHNNLINALKNIEITINNNKLNAKHFLKYSFLVTSYNYAKYISQTLQSLINQTYNNFEIIVVDDGSTDDSINIIKKIQSEYSDKIKLVQHKDKKNHGLIESIKLGISKAQGEYIAFCESDDYLDKNYLFEKDKLLFKYKNKPNIVINDVNVICNNKNKKNNLIEAVNYRKKFFVDDCNTIDIQNFKKFNYICTFSMVMVKKSIIEKLNFNSPVSVNIDWWLWAQICKDDNKIYYVDKRITYWRQHTDSYMSKQKNLSKSKEFMCFSKKIKDIIDQK